MEQIVEYQNIKTLGDISKTFAAIPITVKQEGEKVSFSIANYVGFKALIKDLLKEYDEDIIITENNVSTYEKEAAQINKFIKQIKKDADDFIKQFTVELVGITKGKLKQKGQVQELEDICSSAYNKIHEKTVAYRESIKLKEKQEDAIEVVIGDVPCKSRLFSVEVPNDKVALFQEFCLKNNITIK